MRSTKNIIYKVKLKRKKMAEQEKQEICIMIDDDAFTAKLQLVKWFKESFNLHLKEAKDEIDKIIENWKYENKPSKYIFFKGVNPEKVDIDELIMNSPEGISVSRKNSEMQTVHSKEFDELPSYPKDLMERVKPVYIISVQRMNDIQKQNEDLKSKCKKLDEENNKLREQLNLKELSDALARCENLRVEAKKWKSKYNDLLGSIKTLTNQFN